MSQPESGNHQQCIRGRSLSVADMAQSRLRRLRSTAACSPDCPPELLGGLLCEFPRLVLENPLLPLALAADPKLCASWPVEAFAILGVSTHSRLAHVGARALGGSKAAGLERFLAWAKAEGRPLLDPADFDPELRLSGRGLPLAVNQRLLALSYLAHATGLLEIKIDEFAPEDGGTILTEVRGTAMGTGSELDLDAPWGEMLSSAFDIASMGAEFTHRAMHVTAGERISIRSELGWLLGFELRRTSRKGGLVAEVNRRNCEPKRRMPRDRVIVNAALSRAEETLRAVAPNGLLLWSNSRDLEIGGSWHDSAKVPVIARLTAAVSEDVIDEWNPDEDKSDDTVIVEMIASSVRNDQSGIMCDDFDVLDGEVLELQPAAESIATAVGEALRAAFGGGKGAEYDIGPDGADIICALFSDGQLLRIVGLGANEIKSKTECTLLVSKVVRQSGGPMRPTAAAIARRTSAHKPTGMTSMGQARTLIMTTGSNGAPLFATTETAEATAAAIKALDSSQTWGQFLRALPAHLAGEVREGFEDGELPEADEKFDPSDVPGFADGDFPASINSTMLRELPESIITGFGRTADTVLNGPSVEFRGADLPAILDALRDLGLTVVERPDLVLELP
jgi:hypothetical protein